MTTDTIVLSHHAVERFQERVRPALSLEAAEHELARLVLFGAIVAEAPAWHADSAAQEAPLYLVIADVVLPLQVGARPGEYVATTCLPRGCVSEASRARRRRRRALRAGRRDDVSFHAAARPARARSGDSPISLG